jgi:hypothetical protein
MTSYTLEDIYCRPWHDLYERPNGVMQNMFEEIEGMVRKNDPLASLNFGSHTIKERTSLEHLEVQCDGVHVSPLIKEQRIAGLTSLVTCRPV